MCVVSAVHIPNPSRATIVIDSRCSLTSAKLSSRCKVRFEEGIETTAEWLVRETTPELLLLALQFIFLQLCMELREDGSKAGGRSDDKAQDVYRVIEECRPSRLLCLLIERELGIDERTAFQQRLAGALLTTTTDREYNLSKCSFRTRKGMVDNVQLCCLSMKSKRSINYALQSTHQSESRILQGKSSSGVLGL